MENRHLDITSNEPGDIEQRCGKRRAEVVSIEIKDLVGRSFVLSNLSKYDLHICNTANTYFQMLVSLMTPHRIHVHLKLNLPISPLLLRLVLHQVLSVLLRLCTIFSTTSNDCWTANLMHQDVDDSHNVSTVRLILAAESALQLTSH